MVVLLIFVCIYFRGFRVNQSFKGILFRRQCFYLIRMLKEIELQQQINFVYQRNSTTKSVNDGNKNNKLR